MNFVEPECWLRMAARSGRSRPKTFGNACSLPGCRGAGQKVRKSQPSVMHRVADRVRRRRSAIAPSVKLRISSAGCGCGPTIFAARTVPRIADLFGFGPIAPALEILACTAGPARRLRCRCGQSAARRREANSVAALFQRRAEERAQQHWTGATAPAADRHVAAGARRIGRVSLALHECSVSGPALPESFLRFELAAVLDRRGLLPKPGRSFEQAWDAVRRQVRALGGAGGPLRVDNHIIAPLAACLGYGAPQRQDQVATREGMEEGGWLMRAPDGQRLRAWSVGTDSDLDAPHRSGRAYRFSLTRSASRVLLSPGEPAGLLTDGTELRLLLCDPARPASHFSIPLTGTARLART